LPRGPALAVSVMLSLLSVALALGDEVPARKPRSIAGDHWQPYRSERGGFSLDVPATWSIEERPAATGVLVTLLTPPNGAAVSVASQADTSLELGDADLPNTRCTNVMVAERPARTCLDTISFSVSTTVAGSGKTYVITTNRRRGDQRVYDRILASFRILQ
jgi:hypothetical protein